MLDYGERTSRKQGIAAADVTSLVDEYRAEAGPAGA